MGFIAVVVVAAVAFLLLDAIFSSPIISIIVDVLFVLGICAFLGIVLYGWKNRKKWDEEERIAQEKQEKQRRQDEERRNRERIRIEAERRRQAEEKERNTLRSSVLTAAQSMRNTPPSLWKLSESVTPVLTIIIIVAVCVTFIL